MAILNDGFSTIVSIGGVDFFEKEVTPPGIDGGGPNDTTTMRNLAWRTRQPKFLVTLTESEILVAYDSSVYDDTGTILDNVNVNQLLVITFPDSHAVAFWGWLDKFKANAIKEGEQPTAMITIVPSNQNNSGVEVAPVWS